MADRLEPFTVTIPAGTAIAAPVTVPTLFSDGNVSKVGIKIPPGPSGLMGFRFLHKGAQILPYQGSTWFVMDDINTEWDLTGFPTAGSWQVQGYNTGVYNHSIYVIYFVDEIAIARPATRTVQPIG